MWNNHYWRASRRASRQARRYRYSYHRRSPFIGILLFMLIAFFIWHGSHFLIMLAILGGLTYIGLRIVRSLLGSGNSGFLSSNSNYQQPNQYYQPSQPNQYYQPSQPNQYYQPPASSEPNAPYNQPYQPYGQGYQTSHNDPQQSAQPYPHSQFVPEQYEQPQAQYPQEMPPMA